MVRRMTSATQQRMNRWRTVVDVLLVVTLIAALLAWFFDPWHIARDGFRLRISWGAKPLIAIAVLIAMRVGISRRAGAGDTAGHPLLPRVALSIGLTLFNLVVLEYALAWFGVPPGEPVFVVRGATGPAIRADGSMVSDADLLWRFQPGTVFNGRTVNQLGFLDREVSTAKPAGTHRIMCMGDSCSAQGSPPYSGHLNNNLQQDPISNQTWEAFNTAVHGYSVLQGLALYRTRVRALDPDVVTIFYGWNDHWLATEADAVRLARAGSPLGTAVRNALVRKRVVVALGRLRGKQSDVPSVVQVPPDEYATALATLIREIQADGAIAVVITAPRAETISRRLVHAGHTRSVEEAIAMHDAYADISRRVARETGAHLFDLAAVFNEPANFSDDGIHYTDEGIQHIADLLHRELTDLISTKSL